ncbi:MAG: MBL fold metallo-hydrolase [Parachlamydiales bacterium]|nr:MBL fold metallo-hydrolase [Parachlamydiales bacterium]
MLICKFPFGPLETNAILIGCPETKLGAVVDPSLGSAGAILEKAKEFGIKIEKILLTHSHWDHFADAHILKEKTGAPVYIHFLDAKNIEHPGSDGIPLFFPIHPVSADHFINEGETVAVGKLHFQVIHSPGHSPGSVCFYLEDQNLLISGDTLFQGSIGNLHLPTAEPNQMWMSLEKLAKLPPETRVIPGHGGETTIGKENWLSRAKEIFSE